MYITQPDRRLEFASLLKGLDLGSYERVCDTELLINPAS